MTPPTPPYVRHAMGSEPDWTLLGRFFRGACSPEEAAAIEAWAAADKEHADVLALLRTVWDTAALDLPEIDEASAWRVVRERMASAERPAVVRPLRVVPSGAGRSRRRWLGAALITGAAAALVGTVGAVAWRHNQAVPAAPQPAREYATARGQRSEVTLVDGTRAWLNADSRLRVPSRYGVGARNVELEGEAFFVVRHDEKRPFRVYTRDAVSEDLGTEFSVRSYSEDSAVVVVVASGRVAMGRAGTPADSERKVALGRGQMGRLDRAGHVTVTDGVDLSGPLGWREGRLEFDQKPLADVLRELGRWYDLDIVLDDPSLARVPVTFALDRHPADEALEIVAGVVGLRYVREGRQVRLLARPLRH